MALSTRLIRNPSLEVFTQALITQTFTVCDSTLEHGPQSAIKVEQVYLTYNKESKEIACTLLYTNDLVGGGPMKRWIRRDGSDIAPGKKILKEFNDEMGAREEYFSLSYKLATETSINLHILDNAVQLELGSVDPKKKDVKKLIIPDLKRYLFNLPLKKIMTLMVANPGQYGRKNKDELKKELASLLVLKKLCLEEIALTPERLSGLLSPREHYVLNNPKLKSLCPHILTSEKLLLLSWEMVEKLENSKIREYLSTGCMTIEDVELLPNVSSINQVAALANELRTQELNAHFLSKDENSNKKICKEIRESEGLQKCLSYELMGTGDKLHENIKRFLKGNSISLPEIRPSLYIPSVVAAESKGDAEIARTVVIFPFAIDPLAVRAASSTIAIEKKEEEPAAPKAAPAAPPSGIVSLGFLAVAGAPAAVSLSPTSRGAAYGK